MPCRHIRKPPRQHIARPLDACSFACPVLPGGMPRRYQRSRRHTPAARGILLKREGRPGHSDGSRPCFGCCYFLLGVRFEYWSFGLAVWLAALVGGVRAFRVFAHQPESAAAAPCAPRPARARCAHLFLRALSVGALLHISRTLRQRVSVVAFARGSEEYPERYEGPTAGRGLAVQAPKPAAALLAAAGTAGFWRYRCLVQHCWPL